MFKRIAHIIVISLLLVSTSGISITRHYCGNSLMSLAVFSTPHNCCEGDCNKCHNEHTLTKVTDDMEKPAMDPGIFTVYPIAYPILLSIPVTVQLPENTLCSDFELRKFLPPGTVDLPVLLGNFRC